MATVLGRAPSRPLAGPTAAEIAAAAEGSELKRAPSKRLAYGPQRAPSGIGAAPLGGAGFAGLQVPGALAATQPTQPQEPLLGEQVSRTLSDIGRAVQAVQASIAAESGLPPPSSAAAVRSASQERIPLSRSPAGIARVLSRGAPLANVPAPRELERVVPAAVTLQRPPEVREAIVEPFAPFAPLAPLAVSERRREPILVPRPPQFFGPQEDVFRTSYSGSVRLRDRDGDFVSEPIPINWLRWSDVLRRDAIEAVDQTRGSSSNRVPIIDTELRAWLLKKFVDYFDFYEGELPTPVENVVMSKDFDALWGDEDQFATEWAESFKLPYDFAEAVQGAEELKIGPISNILAARLATYLTGRNADQMANALQGKERRPRRSNSKSRSSSASRSRSASPSR